MEEIVEINKEKLGKLVKYFFEIAAFCNELNIYEYDELNSELSNMKKWVENSYGRRLENL